MSTNSRPNDRSDDTTPFGRDHPQEERKAGLPSDLECLSCGAVIPDQEQCYELRRGINRKLEFTPFEQPKSHVLCVGCCEGVGE